jgi:hypothetical protein
MIARDPQRLQQRFQLQKHLVFPAAKDLRQNSSGAVIDGMPQPPLLFFLALKTPHFVHLGFPCAFNVHGHSVWVEGAPSRRVDRLQRGLPSSCAQ